MDPSSAREVEDLHAIFDHPVMLYAGGDDPSWVMLPVIPGT